MIEKLGKSTMNEWIIEKTYLKYFSLRNFRANKKVKNLCPSLNKKAEKIYFEKATENKVIG